MAKKMSFLKRIKQDLEMDREMCLKQKAYFQEQVNTMDFTVEKLNNDIKEIEEMISQGVRV